MIRVKVDLVPFGYEDKAYQIAEVVIANDGTGDSFFGNYIVARKSNNDTVQFAKVRDFQRSEGVLELIKLCIEAKEEQPDNPDNEIFKRIKGV